MRTRAKVVLIGIPIALALVLAGSIALAAVDVRKIGRNDPKRAANYRLPFRNFAETYVDGKVLGVIVGSTKAEAIQAAERAGLVVSPSGWGDNRAGGASLYDVDRLRATMLKQPHLVFNHPPDPLVMIIRFRADRVASIKVAYINWEAI